MKIDGQLWAAEVRDRVIAPSLRAMGPRYADPAAVRILCMLASHESQFWQLRQRARWDSVHRRWIMGPARGLFGHEKRTHDDDWRNYLVYRPWLAAKVLPSGLMPSADKLVGDMVYAAKMARVHLLRAPAPFPPAADVDALAAYCKRWWNTAGGAASAEDYARDFRAFFPRSSWSG